jgi:hypothetical protein
VEEMKPLSEKDKELEMQIYAIEQQTKMVISHAMIVDYLNKMLALSDTTDDEVLQTIFDNFVEKIVIDNETIKISLFVSTSIGQLEYKVNFGQPHVTKVAEIKRV